MAGVASIGVLRFAAALTDAGLMLVVILGAVAVVVFLVFVVREALNRPVETPRELPPPHDLPSPGETESQSPRSGG